jgi:D-ribose pyranase
VKKIGLLNQPISSLIAGLGHMDTLVIADAGLPIPPDTWRIDLALVEGLPSFVDTLRAVLIEMKVEKAIVASEVIERSPQIFDAIEQIMGHIPVETVTHKEFKEMTHSAQAVIRTGEFTPYANVILVSGVVF